MKKIYSRVLLRRVFTAELTSIALRIETKFMDLGSLLPKKEKSKSESFWSVVIEPRSVQAAVWRIVGEKAEIVGRSLSVSWELSEDLITATDSVLTSAMQELADSDPDPEKTVFGVVSSWVVNGQIAEEHLEQIRQLCSELSLKPAGFVVLSEAISNIVKSEEGSPLSGVVLGVSKDNLELSIFKLGSLLGSTEVARSISVVEDVAEGLTRFADNKSIPSRFLLYDGKEGELEEVRQELIKANWDDYEKIKFLHTPHIEIITPDRKLDAVSLAGAVDIANVTSLMGEETHEVTPTDESESGTPADDNVESIQPEDLGFALGTDITHAMNSPEVNILSSQPEESRDVGDIVAPESRDTQNHVSPIIKPSFFSRIHTKLMSILPQRKVKINKGRSNFSNATKALSIGGVLLVLVLVGAFAAWWYYPKATVTLFLTTNKLDERVSITIDREATSPDFDQAILPGTVVSTTINGEKSRQTTGTKTVGERATGEITLYRVGTGVDLPANTVIDGPGGLSFTLDESVSVASGSAATPGKSTVPVSAESIGSDYNLASGTTFVVDSYSLSDIEAKNDTAFSGGSSREISAVGEEDLENLRKDLEDELKSKALDSLKSELAKSDCTKCTLIPESYSAKDSSTKFSSKVGDEATSVSLTLEQDVQMLAVNQDDLVAFAKGLLNDRIPDGYVLRNDQIAVSFEFNGESDGVYKLTAMISANLLTEVDTESISDSIAGKYPQLAEDYLVKNIPGFARAQIVLKPRLRGRLGTLPHISKNIEIEISADR